MKPALHASFEPVVRSAAAPAIAGIGTALPPFRVTQDDVLAFVLRHFDVGDAARILYRRAMSNPGIETRHFALTSLEECLDANPDRVIDRFQRAATALSVEALTNALKGADATADSIDYLVVSTCTGYVCPGISAHVLEKAGLRADARLADLVGMGCGAAMPALEAAANFISAHPGATAAAISVEICSAALYSNDEPGIIVSNSLFADGAAAVIVRSDPPERNGILHPRVTNFSSVTIPEWRETLRFKTDGGRLKNVLGKDVPVQAASAVSRVADALVGSGNHGGVDRWILHAGGPRVLDEIERELELAPGKIASARDVLRRCGNMSSPTVLFVLAEECRRAKPGDTAVMASFGAGFTAHGATLSF